MPNALGAVFLSYQYPVVSKDVQVDLAEMWLISAPFSPFHCWPMQFCVRHHHALLRVKMWRLVEGIFSSFC